MVTSFFAPPKSHFLPIHTAQYLREFPLGINKVSRERSRLMTFSKGITAQAFQQLDPETRGVSAHGLKHHHLLPQIAPAGKFMSLSPSDDCSGAKQPAR